VPGHRHTHHNTSQPLLRAKYQSGQSNLTKRPHRRCTLTVQSYLSGCATVHPCLIHASYDQPESTLRTASRSVKPFLHSSRQRLPMIYNEPPFLPTKNVSKHGGSGPHLIDGSSSSQPKQHPDRFSGFCRAHGRDRRQVDRQTDRPRYSVCNNRMHLRT